MHPAAYLDRTPRPASGQRRIVIVGGGFGGLACAQALAGADVHVVLVDRRNHHLFQPLLYQVSTAALSPADIAAPLRGVLRRAANVDVLLGEVAGVDIAQRQVQLADGGYLPFDQLVLATGSAYNYFGHPEWAESAPAPKAIADARKIRARLLKAFEDAESSAEPDRRAAALTIVGGGRRADRRRDGGRDRRTCAPYVAPELSPHRPERRAGDPGRGGAAASFRLSRGIERLCRTRPGAARRRSPPRRSGREHRRRWRRHLRRAACCADRDLGRRHSRGGGRSLARWNDLEPLREGAG